MRKPPNMPLTILQKRWMKSLLQDPRIALFDVNADGLEDVEPLFDPSDIVYFDRYADGDPYQEVVYQKNFRSIVRSIRTGQMLEVWMTGRKGCPVHIICDPRRLEYSSKDDKFRILAAGRKRGLILRLSSILSCRPTGRKSRADREKVCTSRASVALVLTNRRSALERCMLHFCDCEKKTQQLDDLHYHIELRYAKEDEAEILIRILSFGPLLEEVGPSAFREQIKTRLGMQQRLVKNH